MVIDWPAFMLLASSYRKCASREYSLVHSSGKMWITQDGLSGNASTKLHRCQCKWSLIGEPSSTRWQYWSRMKAASFCFGKKLHIKKQNEATFHPGPPSGEGSPLPIALSQETIIIYKGPVGLNSPSLAPSALSS